MGRRSHKGISPVIATLLLIIIAVAAGLLIYMWISGYISGQTSGLATQPPKISGASARWAGDTLVVDALVHNPSTSDISIKLELYAGTMSTPTGSSIDSTDHITLKAGELKRIILSASVSDVANEDAVCLLYTSPSPRDLSTSRMPSSA